LHGSGSQLSSSKRQGNIHLTDIHFSQAHTHADIGVFSSTALNPCKERDQLMAKAACFLRPNVRNVSDPKNRLTVIFDA
jgi:hypothetical protein